MLRIGGVALRNLVGKNTGAWTMAVMCTSDFEEAMCSTVTFS